MNASSQRSSGKRPILDAFYTASRVSDVCFATFGARFFGMRGAAKVGSFTAQQSRPLFGFGLFRSDRSKPRLTDFLSGFFGSHILSSGRQHIGVAFHQMFSLRETFEVLYPIICFVVVYVMDLFGWVKIVHPTLCDHTMKKVSVPYSNVSVGTLIQRIGGELSKNFSAARDSVKMIEESVFDSVDCYAGHVVPFGAVMSNQVLT